jgi:DNA-binding response OmpR family regulator
MVTTSHTDAPAARILVVDDEATLLRTLEYNLRKEGYDVLKAARGDDALKLARREHPDLIILDVMLPGLDGFEVCRVVRSESAVPILMLTAKGDEVDRVVGLELGADDYLAKPFGMRELMARVKAMLRRASLQASALDSGDLLRSGNLELNTARRSASLDGRPLALKPKEMDLLISLLRNPRRVFSREQLLDKVWGYDFAGGSRTVDVHVRWLRLKIEPDPANPTRIQTVRGSGYMFEG